MDLKAMKESIETNVYHIKTGAVVPLHKHLAHDEVFYCIEGSGYGLTENSEVALNVGDAFIAQAGTAHGLRSEDNLHVTAVMIPVNKIICHCHQVSYLDIRIAMTNGARTIGDIKEMTKAGTGCGGCVENVKQILSIACGCKMVSMDTVLNTVKNGADTFESVSEITGAGVGCGKCKMLIQNIINTKK